MPRSVYAKLGWCAGSSTRHYHGRHAPERKGADTATHLGVVGRERRRRRCGDVALTHSALALLLAGSRCTVEKWSTAALCRAAGAARCYRPRAVRAAGLVNHTSKLTDAVRGALR